MIRRSGTMISAVLLVAGFFVSATRLAPTGQFAASFRTCESGLVIELHRVHPGTAQIAWHDPIIASVLSRHTSELTPITPNVFHIPAAVADDIRLLIPWSDARRLGAVTIDKMSLIPVSEFAPRGSVARTITSHLQTPSGATEARWQDADSIYMAVGTIAGIAGNGARSAMVIYPTSDAAHSANALADTLTELGDRLHESRYRALYNPDMPTAILIPTVFPGYTELLRSLPNVSNVFLGPYAGDSTVLRTQAAALLIWHILDGGPGPLSPRERSVYSMALGDIVQAQVFHDGSTFEGEWNADLILNIRSKTELHERLSSDPGDNIDANERALQRDALAPTLYSQIRSVSAGHVGEGVRRSSWLNDMTHTGLPGFAECLRVANARLIENSVVEPHSETTAGEPLATLEVLGEYGGILEDCGCKNMTSSGGLSRYCHEPRRQERASSVKVALGDMVGRVGEANRHRSIDVSMLQLLRENDVRTVVLGGRELLALATAELDMSEFGELDLLACNVRKEDGTLVAKPFVDTQTADGRPLRLIGVGGMLPRLTSRRERELVLGMFRFDDPAESVSRAVATAPRNSRIAVVGYVVPQSMPAMAKALPNDAVIVSRYREIPRVGHGGRGTIQLDGTVGAVNVVFPSAGMYGYDLIEWTSGGQSIRHGKVILTGPLPRNTGTAAKIQAVLEAVDELMPIELEFMEPLIGQGARYVGSGTCAECHPKVSSSWEQTAHASAMGTLRQAQRDGIRNCIACHVVGFGQSSGYSRSSPIESLEGVGCEVCHGPGSLHVERPMVGTFIRRVPGRALCASCHTLMHSDFLLHDAVEYVRRIDHHEVDNDE